MSADRNSIPDMTVLTTTESNKKELSTVKLLRIGLLASLLIAFVTGLYFLFVDQSFMIYLVKTQQQLHRELANLLQQVQNDSTRYGPSLLLASFLYGIFHAAGPGHGKAIIATYMGTQVASLKKGVQLSFLAAFLQACVAVLLVTGLVKLLQLSIGQSQWIGQQLEAVSYLLVVAMGFLLCLRQWKPLTQARSVKQKKAESQYKKETINVLSTKNDKLEIKGFKPVASQAASFQAGYRPILLSQHHLQKDGQCSCGHKHLPLPDEIESGGWREHLAIVVSMGIRPCTGAVLVLMLANMLGLFWYGVLSALLMALGTAITVSSIALLSVSVRRYAGNLLRIYQKTEGRGKSLHYLPFFGGCLLILLGSSLFYSFLQISQQSRPF